MLSPVIGHPRELLQQIGTKPSEPVFDLAGAALALAALEEEQPDLTRYHKTLRLMAADVAEAMGDRRDTLHARAAALRDVVIGKYGFDGDRDTYDDVRNANLMQVIDRRRGLPVALGILFIDAARRQGWRMVGLSFPGHFLVRLEHETQGRLIIDPFNGGATPDAAVLRQRLRALMGPGAELGPEHYEAVSDRGVLLRLQNNLKLRYLSQKQADRAASVIEQMLLIAPDEAFLWREAGLINAHLGNLNRAIRALEHYLDHGEAQVGRHEVAVLLQQLKERLN